MSQTRRVLGTNDIFVVEVNDGHVYLGRIKVTRRTLTVYTGKTGRPPVIDLDEVDAVVPAFSHPDVEVLR